MYSVELSVLLHGLELGTVGGVRNEKGHVLSHRGLGQVVDGIELFPELLVSRLGSLGGLDLDGLPSEGGHDAQSRLVVSVVTEVLHTALLGQDEHVEGRGVLASAEASESIGVFLADTLGIDELGKTKLEDVLAVVLPYAEEVGLVDEFGGELMGEADILLLHHLGVHVAHAVPLGLESFAAFRGGGVKSRAEVEGTVLVGVSEGVKAAVLLGVVIAIFLSVVAAKAPPAFVVVGVGNLVVEEALAVAVTVLLHAEPLKDVGLLALTAELSRGPLSTQVLLGLIPGLAGVKVDVPAVEVLSLGPVGNTEALENTAGLAVEGNLTHTLEKGLGVEVLRVQVEHNVGLLVELVTVNVLDADACFSGFLGVEPVGEGGEVGLHEAVGVGDVLLGAGAGVADEFDPALLVLGAHVVAHGFADDAAASEGGVHKSVEKSPFHSCCWCVSPN